MVPIQGGSPFAFNFLLLGILLVPGYLSLRGYLRATVQLDTISRLDKVLLAVVGGTATLGIMLLLNRFGVFQLIGHWFDPLWGDEFVLDAIGYDPTRAVSPSDISRTPALTIILFATGQSCLGYAFGYALGTIVYASSARPQRSEEDIQQPWETAIRQVGFGSEVTVVTADGDRITGKIDRVGSPSERSDLLLWAAQRERQGGDPEFLGVVYIQSQDISRIRLDVTPQGQGDVGNWLVKKWTEYTETEDDASGLD